MIIGNEMIKVISVRILVLMIYDFIAGAQANTSNTITPTNNEEHLESLLKHDRDSDPSNVGHSRPSVISIRSKFKPYFDVLSI